MDLMAYDALALGVLDVGPDEVNQSTLGQAGFAVLSANTTWLDGSIDVEPYVIVEQDGFSVAIVGVTHPAMEERAQSLGLDVIVEDPIAAVGRVVAEAAQRADVIVLLSNVDRDVNLLLAEQAPGIDVIIGARQGWRGEPMSVPAAAGQVILNAAGVRGEYLGTLHLGFDADGRVVAYHGGTIGLMPDLPDDPGVVQLTDEILVVQ